MRKFELLTPTAIEPKRATFASAGYDLFADETVVIPPGETKKINTGIAAKFPENEVLLIFLRSSLSSKRNLILGNGVGMVDADYYPNEIGVLLHNPNEYSVIIYPSDKIAQGLFSKYEKTDDDNPVEKERTGGFGSSGER